MKVVIFLRKEEPGEALELIPVRPPDSVIKSVVDSVKNYLSGQDGKLNPAWVSVEINITSCEPPKADGWERLAKALAEHIVSKEPSNG